jgi:hypothetical protein
LPLMTLLALGGIISIRMDFFLDSFSLWIAKNKPNLPLMGILGCSFVCGFIRVITNWHTITTSCYSTPPYWWCFIFV